MKLKVYRGEILHFLADPAKQAVESCYQYFADGLLIINDGLVQQVGDALTLFAVQPWLTAPGSTVEIVHYQNGLIMPGFVDSHIHFAQTEMIASYGEQLLQWLENYTFPTERKFNDEAYARQVAEFFLDQLLAAGTTTAMVFATVHRESVEAFFKAAQARRLRMICGKVLMDQNCPADLADNPESAYADSKALIDRWHQVDRLQYAVTPRFAPTCSRAQLNAAGQLLKQYPDVYLQTHLCENQQEIEWVAELFPDSSDYLDVYDQSGLLGRRSVFAHGVHLSDQQCQRLATTGSAIAFCPTSNLFLGSGLFNLPQAQQHNVNVALGTDIGAGTSFSMLRTISEAYKTQQLRGHSLNPFEAFYLATLGGAQALDLSDKIGNFTPGKEADFIFIDYNATPLMAKRIAHCQQLADKLFVLAMLGDERFIKATHIMGERVMCSNS